MKGPVYPVLGKGMLRQFSKLGGKKYRDEAGIFLAEGLRTVRELLDHLPSEEMLVALMIGPGADHESVRPERCAGKVYSIGKEQEARLAQTTTPQGVFGVFRQMPAWRQGTKMPSFVVALDDVQDPGNVGTIVRTAAWFGADAVVCGRGTADPFNAKAVRSSAGSLYAVGLDRTENLGSRLQLFRQAGYLIIASTLDGSDYRSVDGLTDLRVLVVGNEANGISGSILELADRLVKIPHSGDRARVESLNAAVSAAILMSGLAFA